MIGIPFNRQNNLNNRQMHESVAFGSNFYKSSCEMLHRKQAVHSTFFFRDNINLQYAENLANKFPHGCKIYNYACSDGSEAYSLALLLIQKLGIEEAKRKYFPIIAKDIGKEVIHEAKNGFMCLYDEELGELNDALKSAGIRNFEKVNASDNFNNLIQQSRFIADARAYQVPTELRNCVKFSVGDIRKDAASPDAFKSKGKAPSLLMFRNAMYHLKEDERNNLFRDLHQNPSFVAGSIFDCHEFGKLIGDNTTVDKNAFVACNEMFNKTGIVNNCNIFEKSKIQSVSFSDYLKNYFFLGTTNFK
jgi:chemotaxis methyl-accepting protein methylase